MERGGFSSQVISGGMLDRGKGWVMTVYSYAGKRWIGCRNRVFFDVSLQGIRYPRYYKFENDMIFAFVETMQYDIIFEEFSASDIGLTHFCGKNSYKALRITQSNIVIRAILTICTPIFFRCYRFSDNEFNWDNGKKY